MYRDDLIQAKRRIDELETRLDSQEAELAAVRAQLSKRIDSQHRRRPSRFRGIAASTALMTIGGAIAWTAADPTREEPKPNTSPSPRASSVDNAETGDNTKKPKMLLGSHARSSDLRVELPDDARVARLASRCERKTPRDSF